MEEKNNIIRKEIVKMRRSIIEERGCRCEHCNVMLNYPYGGITVCIHHKIKIEDGGDNNPDNLEVLCRPCHAKVHNQGFIKQKVIS